jgi:type 1 fimbria pilin
VTATGTEVGVSYVVESGASRGRRERRRRALITLGVVALMLFFAFWYAYSYYRSDASKPAAAPTPTCTATKTIAPKSVTVNVYNSTERNGLAAKTATEVKKRGFTVRTVANDPLHKKVAGPAEVRYGTAGKQQANLVIALVKGAKAVPDKRTDASVDLVIGAKYTALAPPPKAAKAGNANANATSKPTGKATSPTKASGGC